MTNIHTIECKNVKCYLIASNNGYLLFDAGWTHQYGLFKDIVKAIGISVKEITTFIVSHFHVDHGGLAGILTANGKDFVVFENQRKSLSEMEDFIERRGYSYRKIDVDGIQIKRIDESRDWLRSLAIDGEIIQIHGHGDQSIALLLDTGEAFIGDLPPEYNYDEIVRSDWNLLLQKGAKYIFPAHAKYFEIKGINSLMEIGNE
jgi:glyoxylase-like metal-dependent hydrolase (beta-lactamase superfamily II)